tara:strand:+ start:2592 stop:3422 length:831 start_codon:yes stop_codon:yes gene_type:complete
MSESAFQKQFRQEYIAGFEKGDSYLRKSVTTETVIKGNQAEFLIADSGGASAVTRGVNGLIPARHDNNTQVTCTLTEWHDLVRKTGFNIFASQGDQRRIMQDTTRKVMNRKFDEQIRTALSAATTTWGSAAVPTLSLITKAKTILRNNSAGGGQLFAAITPAFHGYMMGLNEFTSADYISDKKFEGASKDMAFNWYGVNWIVDEELDGVGTASATCYMYNQMAIGHGCDTQEMKTHVGYEEEQDYSYARVSAYCGAKLLQNSGVIKMLANDSALSS